MFNKIQVKPFCPDFSKNIYLLSSGNQLILNIVKFYFTESVQLYGPNNLILLKKIKKDQWCGRLTYIGDCSVINLSSSANVLGGELY